MTYRPLFSRFSVDHAARNLHEGVPEWLRDGLLHWIKDWMPCGRESVLAIEQRLRLTLGLGTRPGGWERRNSVIQALIKKEDDEWLLELCNVLLYMLSAENYLDEFRPTMSPFPDENPATAADGLSDMLRNSGSAWTVSERDGIYCLERRVSTPTKDRAEELMSPGDRAAEHLRDAWTALYARTPNYDHAADQSVKAVEAAMRAVLLPNDTRATLGKACSHLRDAAHKYEVPAAAPGNTQEATLPVLVMMQTLWGTYRRHGTDDASVPKGTSSEEAEICVHLAFTLVHLFRAGLIRRRL